MTNTATDADGTTDWTVVWMATFAGITVAMQMAKVSVSLPLLRAEFGASLTLLSVYVSLISFLAATVGILFGSVTRQMGARRAGLLGLGLVAIGSATASEAGGVNVLMISRVIEAIGFALAVTAMPAVIQPATQARDRMVALGIWAIWLPAGIALMMLIAYPFLDTIGWRGLFRITALLPALSAVMLYGATKTQINPAHLPATATVRGIFRRDVVLTTLLFSACAVSNLALLSFLPTILVDDFGYTPADASLVLFAGSVGIALTNILGGWLLKHGAGPKLLYMVSFMLMLAGAYLFLASDGPAAVRIGGSVLYFLAVGVPMAIIWASVPILARNPSEVPVMSGLLFQGAGVGQLTGPILAGWAVDRTNDWSTAFWVILGSVFLAMLLTLSLGNFRASDQADH